MICHISYATHDMLNETTAHYKILRTLGQGAHSSVFAAVNAYDQNVAIKVVSLNQNSSAVSLDRLQREAQFIKSLRHPNIV